jgi:endogenous inhibitor of DNA gyrase (YacG/DUF329 family)
MEKQKCINCGKEVPQKEGRRQRKFCDNNGKCRVAYFHKTHPKEKKYVLKERDEAVVKERDELKAQLNMMQKFAYLELTKDNSMFNEENVGKSVTVTLEGGAHYNGVAKDAYDGLPLPKDYIDEPKFGYVTPESNEVKPLVFKGKEPKEAVKKPAKKDRLPVAVDRMLQDIPVEDRPVREKGESGFTYSIRLAEYKDKQKGK